MSEKYRIRERSNVTIGGRPVTTFALFERRPHPIQNHAYELVGRYMTSGHNAADHECINAALAEIYGDDDA